MPKYETKYGIADTVYLRTGTDTTSPRIITRIQIMPNQTASYEVSFGKDADWAYDIELSSHPIFSNTH